MKAELKKKKTEEIMTQNFQNMVENIKIQEAHWTSRKINKNKVIPRRTLQSNYKKAKVKGKTLKAIRETYMLCMRE